jgi:hypothetical protein
MPNKSIKQKFNKKTNKKLNKKLNKKTNKKTNKKRNKTKKYSRDGGMIKKVFSPVGKGVLTVTQKYGENVLQDEVLNKKNSLSNKIKNTQTIIKPNINVLRDITNIQKMPLSTVSKKYDGTKKISYPSSYSFEDKENIQNIINMKSPSIYHDENDENKEN